MAAYTKNYYAVLNLPEPSPSISSRTTPSISATQIRAQYRAALLAAHPDKNHSTAGKKGQYSVDDVKEAFAVLSDARQKRAYDAWLRTSGGGVAADAKRRREQEDFVLGLEALDLSDFTEFEIAGGGGSGSGSEEDGAGVEWRRACRCGHETGFRITEEELECAVQREEKEVLVGCEGCSLWVRVGFEVEEG